MHDEMLKAPCPARPRPNDAIVEPLREDATIAQSGQSGEEVGDKGLMC
jgi:hypothetical protein